ncbi:zinc finger protein 385A [Nematolebias whitei]|uniref:zinc finger protein 385A n=1 Tax=Nematolebias whitei TaxID=451745 RepID=UPI001896ADAC|nr:zinc finger protein 385A [Nematolebias whitei]
MILGSVNRPGPVPAFFRNPPVMSPHLDMKTFLQFPLKSHHPASMGLFHNFKANQAEAHYKGNRHARRVKGIETPKTSRLQDGDKQPPPASPSPPGLLPCSPDPNYTKQDDTESPPSFKESPLTPSSLSAQIPADPECPLLSSVSTPLPSSSSSPFAALSNPSADPDTPSPAPSPSSGESEEEKAKKLLYCSVCKVAVNSVSQLEAHNKGTKHKTILEAQSGLGPIKVYPRLGPKPSPEQGREVSNDPNSQERTFHCEICNVRVSSELQLKQHISSRRHRDGVAGKPNPLLSRHKKRKDFMELPKTLGPGLLPNPLVVVAAMAAAASSNQLALCPPGLTSRPHHPHPHLLQGTPLSLLRPAPGPIRTAHGPVLFTPY